MPTECWAPIRGRAMRLTRLNACGQWVAGPLNTLTTGGFVSVGLSFQYEDGEQTRKKNANGDLCHSDNGKSSLAQIDAEINFCGIDPDAYNIITGNPLSVDRTGKATGLRISETVNSNWALEVWTDLGGAGCGEDGLVPYGYLLLPWFYGGRIGDMTVEEAAMDLTVTSSTKRLHQWGVGPYNVTLKDGAAPEDPGVVSPLLTPLLSTEPMLMDITLVPPPAPACGATTLTPVTP